MHSLGLPIGAIREVAWRDKAMAVQQAYTEAQAQPNAHGQERSVLVVARDEGPVGIEAGEHLYGREDALDALATGGVTVLQPDASISGGITESREIANLAQYYGARVVPHVCAGPVSLAAIDSTGPRQAGPAGALQAMAARQCRSMYWRCEGRGPCRLLEGLPQPGKQPRRVDMGAQIDQRIVVLGPDLRDCAVGIFPQRACSGPAERAEYVCALLPEYVCGPL